MARPRKPTHLHEVNGTYRGNPERRRTDEPQPKGDVGAPPERPSTDWRECWDEIAGWCCYGVLGDSDRGALEMAARLLAEMRADSSGMSASRLRILGSLLGRFGLTPADRSKVTARSDGEASPAKKYLA